jgi:TRAP-type C4-dicarboxylate transport system permease small subunit
MSVWLRRAANEVGAGLFLALFGVFIVQITARFGFSRPLPWTDEAAVILYVWVILWATATMVPQRAHVAFDLIWNSVGPDARRVMQISGNVLVGGLALVALPASWDYVRFMLREGTPVLGMPLFWVYLPFVLMLLALVLRCGFAVRQALRGQGLDAELRL